MNNVLIVDENQRSLYVKAKYLDAGENQQGDIQRESERAEAAWKDGHVRLLL